MLSHGKLPPVTKQEIDALLSTLNNTSSPEIYKKFIALRDLLMSGKTYQIEPRRYLDILTGLEKKVWVQQLFSLRDFT